MSLLFDHASSFFLFLFQARCADLLDRRALFLRCARDVSCFSSPRLNSVAAHRCFSSCEIWFCPSLQFCAETCRESSSSTSEAILLSPALISLWAALSCFFVLYHSLWASAVGFCGRPNLLLAPFCVAFRVPSSLGQWSPLLSGRSFVWEVLRALRLLGLLALLW